MSFINNILNRLGLRKIKPSKDRPYAIVQNNISNLYSRLDLSELGEEQR